MKVKSFIIAGASLVKLGVVKVVQILAIKVILIYMVWYVSPTEWGGLQTPAESNRFTILDSQSQTTVGKDVQHHHAYSNSLLVNEGPRTEICRSLNFCEFNFLLAHNSI